MIKPSYKNAILNKNTNVEEDNIVNTTECNLNNNDVNNDDTKKNLKKNINDIFIVKDSIPSKEDILRLCSHGKHNKINLIHNSYFNNENVDLCMKHMHNKITEIKKWEEEPCNNNSSSKKRFKDRINSIYKTIQLFKNKHLEYLSDSILNKPKIEIIQEVKVVPKIETKIVPKVEAIKEVSKVEIIKDKVIKDEVIKNVSKIKTKVGSIKEVKVVKKFQNKKMFQNKKTVEIQKEIDDLINDGWVKVGK
jgi:hypothetical protein